LAFASRPLRWTGGVTASGLSWTKARCTRQPTPVILSIAKLRPAVTHRKKYIFHLGMSHSNPLDVLVAGTEVPAYKIGSLLLL